MKLITLNLWGGKIYEPLIKFIATHSSDTDIFCFQDVLFGSRSEFSAIQQARINLSEEIQKVLPGFNMFRYSDPEESFVGGELLPPDVGCGQAIFVRRDIEVLENGGFRSHPESSYHKGGDFVSGRCQWIKIRTDNPEKVTILNLHGLWKRDSNKKDIAERIEQSQKIKEFLKNHNSKKVVCGDFNIVNDGNAIDLLEDGLINLIKKYKVASTRSSHYPKEEKFADYILTSTSIKINDFKVLQDEISDHLPLLIDFK